MVAVADTGLDTVYCVSLSSSALPSLRLSSPLSIS